MACTHPLKGPRLPGKYVSVLLAGVTYLIPGGTRIYVDMMRDFKSLTALSDQAGRYKHMRLVVVAGQS